MADHEVAMLKAALYNQYTVMRKLCMELEEEREASATAASEALSMILRLEREKSAEKMEASQYKRIAEERMEHAEECLVILEEVMQHKEDEISDLKAQIQEFKEKISSIDIGSAHSECIQMEKNFLPFQRIDVMAKTSQHFPVRRTISMPSLRLDAVPWETDARNQNCFVFQMEKPRWQRNEEYKDRILHRRKEFSKSLEGTAMDEYNPEVTRKMKYETSRAGIYHTAKGDKSWSPEKESSSKHNAKYSNPNTIISSALGTVKARPDIQDYPSSSSQDNDHENDLDCDKLTSSKHTKLKGMVMHSPCAHDIFEVPESNSCYVPSEPCDLFCDESVKATKVIMCREDLVPRERIEYLVSDNRMLNETSVQESRRSNFSVAKKGASVQQTSRLSNSAGKGSLMSLVNRENGNSSSRNNFEQIKCRLQQLENDNRLKLESSESSNDQLKLLREIYEQLNCIEHHLKASPSKKFPMHDESKLAYVMEAVLSFSI